MKNETQNEIYKGAAITEPPKKELQQGALFLFYIFVYNNMYMNIELFQQFFWLIILAAVWTIPWKGAALWRAARAGHKGWFIALLLLNTLAIMEILYIFVFSKKKK